MQGSVLCLNNDVKICNGYNGLYSPLFPFGLFTYTHAQVRARIVCHDNTREKH